MYPAKTRLFLEYFFTFQNLVSWEPHPIYKTSFGIIDCSHQAFKQKRGKVCLVLENLLLKEIDSNLHKLLVALFYFII